MRTSLQIYSIYAHSEYIDARGRDVTGLANHGESQAIQCIA